MTTRTKATLGRLIKRIAAQAAITAMMVPAIASWVSETDWELYPTWRNANNEWYLAQREKKNPDGTPYYTVLSPAWYPESGVLIHYFNDRKLTEGNLSPMMTSTVDMIYIGHLYNDTVFDSSYDNTTYGDSIFRTQPNAVIEGWQIALNDMRVGDTCEVVIPYPQAYGTSGQGSIPPYSVLRFNMKLVGIPAYEIPDTEIDD